MNWKSGIPFLVLLSAVFGVLIPAGVELSAVDQVKTTEFFVGDSESQLTNTTVNQPFSLYIGDDLTGITNPVKAVYFTVTGVYTGNGALGFKIDGDPITSKSFTLPDVSTSTSFEIIYKDDSNKINPTAAGSYSYTLNISVPAGLTVSGLGASAELTHRYAPPSCPDGQPANEKIKTTEFFVGDSESSFTSQVDKPFSLYIGDDLTGITNPVKSVFFVVSGLSKRTIVSPTLRLQLDSDSNTNKTFILADTNVATPFEIIYKDDSNKINPTTAGSYSYTLNVIPVFGTIYGLGVKVVVTHRYKPPSCGGYPATGELTSMVFDTGTEGAAYNSVMWKGEMPSNTKVRLQLATSDCPNGATDYPTCSVGGWNYLGGASCSSGGYYEPSPNEPAEIGCFISHNNKRYFRYKAVLCSDASSNCVSGGSNTPRVDDVVVSWSP